MLRADSLKKVWGAVRAHESEKLLPELYSAARDATQDSYSAHTHSIRSVTNLWISANMVSPAASGGDSASAPDKHTFAHSFGGRRLDASCGAES